MNNIDLQKEGVNTRDSAYNHLITYGIREGRNFIPFRANKEYDPFDWKYYVNKYIDLQKAGINTKGKAFLHWIKFGKKEGRTCSNPINVDDTIQNDESNYKFLEPPYIIKDYITKNGLTDRVSYTGKITYDDYNEIITGCDIALQIRAGNGGGLSGSVVDCLSVDIPVITTQDIVDSLDITHDMLIGFDLTKYDDWISIKNQFNGYSDKLTKDISGTILVFNENKKKGIMINNGNQISSIINKRSDNYPNELIKILSVNDNSKIAIVTPYPPDFTGIADFSFTTIQQLSKYVNNIDIFTDADTIGNNIYKIDEIQNKYKNYDNIIYVVGNSLFHTKIINYLKELGGACILHDERLVHLYSCLGKLPKDFIIDDLRGHSSLCFDEIIHANPLIVHSKKLQKIIKNVYNKDPSYIPFCSFNNLHKYDYETIMQIKNKYKIDGDINIVVNGRVKYCYQALKISEYLKTKNIFCKLFFVGP